MTQDGWLSESERNYYVEKLTLEYETFDDNQLTEAARATFCSDLCQPQYRLSSVDGYTREQLVKLLLEYHAR